MKLFGNYENVGVFLKIETINSFHSCFTGYVPLFFIFEKNRKKGAIKGQTESNVKQVSTIDWDISKCHFFLCSFVSEMEVIFRGSIL